jgi:uncharacterized protein GlcG (DUF336 family)
MLAKRILGMSRFWLILLGVLATAPLAYGQTAQIQTLSLDGARALLHAAEQKAQQLSAPSSLAVGKARSAARFREATHSLEAAIEAGRAAAITAGAIQMDGGVPILIGGAVVGAVGVSGLDHHNDLQIAESAAVVVK